MLFVFSGGDTMSVRNAAHTFLDTFETNGAETLRLTAEAVSEDVLRDAAGAASLFGGEQIVLLDMPSESKEAFEALRSLAPTLAESKNTFVVIEGKLLAADAKILKKYAKKYSETKTGEKRERFNVFTLADALTRRDKRSLWIGLMRAHSVGLRAEEIIGTLFWQVKAMRLAARAKSASASGLKPFVYGKAKRGAEKYSKDELHGLSRDLLRVYHDGHFGVLDIDEGLERWVLKV